MQLFYCDDIKDKIAFLTADEVHHLRVLHYNVGDSIILMDGKGNKITGVIDSLKKKTASVSILSIEKQPPPERNFNLCIAPTKNINRIEWCVEKITELGVHNIYFFRSAHSERKEIKLSRIVKKIISASKQSFKWYYPKVFEIVDYEDLIAMEDFNNHIKLLAHLGENSENAVSVIRLAQKKTLTLTVLIGPEGDFNEKELHMAAQYGWVQGHLGKERLRTETAALYVTTLNYCVQYL